MWESMSINRRAITTPYFKNLIKYDLIFFRALTYLFIIDLNLNWNYPCVSRFEYGLFRLLAHFKIVINNFNIVKF